MTLLARLKGRLPLAHPHPSSSLPLPLPHTLLRLQTIPNTLPDALLKLLLIISPQRRRLDIRRTLIIRTTQHRYHG